MIKYVAFDFDGTMVDSQAVFISVTNQLAEKYKFKKITPDVIGHLRQLSLHERFQFMGISLLKLPVLTAKFLHLYRQYLHDINLMEGIDPLLKALKERGYSIAILSSNAESTIKQYLLSTGLQASDVFCSSNLFGKDKLIKKFLKKYRLKPSEVLYVGDEQRDIVACKKCGVKIVWVAWGYDIKEVVNDEKPDYMVTTPSEILDILSSISDH